MPNIVSQSCGPSWLTGCFVMVIRVEPADSSGAHDGGFVQAGGRSWLNRAYMGNLSCSRAAASGGCSASAGIQTKTSFKAALMSIGACRWMCSVITFRRPSAYACTKLARVPDQSHPGTVVAAEVWPDSCGQAWMGFLPRPLGTSSPWLATWFSSGIFSSTSSTVGSWRRNGFPLGSWNASLPQASPFG